MWIASLYPCYFSSLLLLYVVLVVNRVKWMGWAMMTVITPTSKVLCRGCCNYCGSWGGSTFLVPKELELLDISWHFPTIARMSMVSQGSVFFVFHFYYLAPVVIGSNIACLVMSPVRNQRVELFTSPSLSLLLLVTEQLVIILCPLLAWSGIKRTLVLKDKTECCVLLLFSSRYLQ